MRWDMTSLWQLAVGNARMLLWLKLRRWRGESEGVWGRRCGTYHTTTLKERQRPWAPAVRDTARCHEAEYSLCQHQSASHFLGQKTIEESFLEKVHHTCPCTRLKLSGRALRTASGVARPYFRDLATVLFMVTGLPVRSSTRHGTSFHNLLE